MPLGDPVDALTEVARRLDRAGIAYMLTGSVAGYFHGLNRSTADTDIIVDLPPGRATAFVKAFRDGYFIDPVMVDESLRSGTIFNIMPMAGGKLDIIPLTDDVFERTKFGRRVLRDWHGHAISVCTAADLVLSKPRWAKD